MFSFHFSRKKNCLSYFAGDTDETVNYLWRKLETHQNQKPVETKLKIISDALNTDKFKKPTNDPVILSEKLNLFIQRRDLLTEFLKAPQFVKPKGKKITDMKAAYEKLLKETTDAIPALTTERNNAQAALDASRKKKKP